MTGTDYDLPWKLSQDETGIDEPIGVPRDKNPAAGFRHVLESGDLDSSKEEPGEESEKGDYWAISSGQVLNPPDAVLIIRARQPLVLLDCMKGVFGIVYIIL